MKKPYDVKRVRRSGVPPASVERWYHRSRPCQTCRGRVVEATGTKVSVLHEPACEALKG
jgi:hypothetical protein